MLEKMAPPAVGGRPITNQLSSAENKNKIKINKGRLVKLTRLWPSPSAEDQQGHTPLPSRQRQM
jgi:hypothetical protein